MIREICNILFSKRIAGALTVMILLAGQTLHAQADRKYVRQGNRNYGKNNFSESEISYRKATDTNKSYPDAVFNTGDALYKQNKFEDAGKQFLESAKMNEDPVKKSASMFNLGNSLLKANKLEESIEAYKSSLKLNPESPEAKYNLAYAQDMLKKQKEQQQQQQQNKDNQDQKKDQNKKDQKDQKDQQKDKKDEQKNEKQDQNQQQEQQGVSKDDAERLLNALANEEKNVQEKVKLAKAAKEKVRTVKNW